jgi:hypothetical protein
MSVDRHARSTPEVRKANGNRESLKQRWLAPIFADLKTPAARQSAKEHKVSTRLAASVAGLIVNLNSFIDRGYVYATAAGLGKHIKNANGGPTSERQIRRVITFLADRDHLRVVARPGRTNLLYPRYRKIDDILDTMSNVVARDLGHDVQPPRTSCPPKLILKSSTQTTETSLPQPPLSTSGQTQEGQPNGGSRYEPQDVVLSRIAPRLGYGSAEAGWLILLDLSAETRDRLVALQRKGMLTDDEIAVARASVPRT